MPQIFFSKSCYPNSTADNCRMNIRYSVLGLSPVGVSYDLRHLCGPHGLQCLPLFPTPPLCSTGSQITHPKPSWLQAQQKGPSFAQICSPVKVVLPTYIKTYDDTPRMGCYGESQALSSTQGGYRFPSWQWHLWWRRCAGWILHTSNTHLLHPYDVIGPGYTMIR